MSIHSNYPDHIAYLQAAYTDALAATGFDALVLHAGRCVKRRQVDDQAWPLKVNPSFAHWLPLIEEDATLVIVPSQTAKLLQADRSDFWHGTPPAPSDHFWSSFDGIKTPFEKFSDHLPSGRVAFIGDCVDVAKSWGIAAEGLNPASLIAKLDAVRAIKSAYELDCLARASLIGARGHVAAEALFRSGNPSELDIQLAFLQATQQDGLDTPYGNIVALGEHGAILHHEFYGREAPARSDLSLLIDAGATSLGYACDITRTYVRGESAEASQFRSLIEGVTALHMNLCGQVAPGVAYEELHNRAHVGLADLLIDSGICSGSAEALLEGGITRAFFPHGLGHSLGLQVHDVGCRLLPPADENPFLRNTSTIALGQVFTIEPGCYFIAPLLDPLRDSDRKSLINWSTVDALAPFGGIRIEDNLAVTDNGVLNLTRDNWPR